MSGGVWKSRLLAGRVMHHRMTPRQHHFEYGVRMFRFDIDELAELDRACWWFGYNRRALVSLRDADYLVEPGRGLAADVRAWITERGIDGLALRITVDTFARVWGYAFNPVSFFRAFSADGVLRCVVAEINNTFGERHRYLLSPANEVISQVSSDGRPGTGRAFDAAKVFHVSPFISMHAAYRFTLDDAGDATSMRIDESENGRLFFVALQKLVARPLTTAAALGALARAPLMTVKVIAAIHWEALWLWLKRVPVFRKPAPPADDAAVMMSGEAERNR